MGILDLKRHRWAALALCAGVALSGCTKAAPGGGAAGGRRPYTIPHVLRYTTATDIGGLNPLLHQEFVLSLTSSLTMAWLFRFDVHNRPVPELALEVPTQKNGGISADGLTIRYKLRPNVKWSDDVPFTAKDVVFTGMPS